MLIDGNAVREYREERGISIDEMADMLGIDGEALCGYENGVDWLVDDPMTVYVLSSICEDLDWIPAIEEEELEELFEEYGIN